MSKIRRNSTVRTGVALAAVLMFAAACSDGNEQDGPAECGGNGDLHGDHCHCDPGFVVTPDQLSCVAEADVGADVVDPIDLRDLREPTDVTEPTEADTRLDGMVDTSQPAADVEAGATDVGVDATYADATIDTSDVSDDAVDVADADGMGVTEFQLVATSTRAATGVAGDGTHVWLLNAEGDEVRLRLEIYEGFGGLAAPGTADVTAVETDYATCGTCVILETECVPHGDHVDCARTFMPEVGGQVHLDATSTAAGEQFAGELRGLVFREVTIAQDYTTQPVTGGQRLDLQTWPFDVQLESLGGGSNECSGHGHLHGNVCHCDPGYELDPNDSTQCIPE